MLYVQQICEIISTRSRLSIRENLDPRKFSAICYVNTFIENITPCRHRLLPRMLVYTVLSGDEPEGLEDIPEYEQAMRCGRVICTNYSLLYGHLDADKLLPKLPEKDLIDENQLKEAKSFHQRFAKNAHVIRILLWYDRPSHGLLKFCDTLETTPGQEHLGRKLLKGMSIIIGN